MSNLERIYQIDQILEARRSVTKAELLERLGVSWATLKRDLAYMRDRLNAPIIFDREMGAYRFENSAQRVGPQYELPGLWFSAPEIHALLTMQHLLANLDTGGLLGPHIQPLLSRLSGMLGVTEDPAEEIRKRIRIDEFGSREFDLSHFQTVGSALLRRKRLLIKYHARGTNEITEREISPQRLVYYRHNWYLDAYCHLRDGLRAFSVECIRFAEILNTRANHISEKEINDKLGEGYGIFSGKQTHWATLHFSAERARWIVGERWHPKQKGKWLTDGTYELKIPYSDHRELLMDILKHGRHCQVVEPNVLKQAVLDELKAIHHEYGRA